MSGGTWEANLWAIARIDETLDPIQAAAARFTVITVIVSALAVSAFCVGSALLERNGAYLYAAALAYVTMCGFAFFLVRNGHIQIATHGVVLLNCSAAAYFMIIEGPQTKHVGIFFIAIIAAGWLARPIAAVAYGIAAAAVIIASNLAASAGVYTPTAPISENAWTQVVSQIVAAGALVGFLVRSLHRALAELRVSQQARLERERERLALESKLLRAQKTEALGRLAGGVAHDFNNFLTVVLLNASALADEDTLDEITRLQVEEIEEAARKATNVTRQLLAFGRNVETLTKTLDLRLVLEGIERVSRRLLGEGVAFSLTLGEEPLLVHADPVQLEQVAINLVVNAQDAMPSGGEMRFVGEAVVYSPEEAEELGLSPGPWIRLQVSDTGEGIDDEIVHQIFDPFFSTKSDDRGTGLGLSTVALIMSRIGGCVHVRSEPNAGTTFTLYFPEASAETETESASPGPEPTKAPLDAVVCVVDDDPAIRKVVERHLVSEGYRVIAAEDAASAMSAIESAAVQPSVLLTDVVLREGSGREVAAEFREHFPGRPILFMSAYSGTVLADHGVEGEETPVLCKPFTRDELLRKLSSLLVS